MSFTELMNVVRLRRKGETNEKAKRIVVADWITRCSW